ncbi:killer cell lectin-like receptor subfamily B member 1A [Grus japonensis]|uniref:Killer cell lectin-like receptor subfamily B member 1A n=1 Tax=Grus japonensis TaxID=30415 RepID=A0ABC9XVE6_GRUJA
MENNGGYIVMTKLKVKDPNLTPKPMDPAKCYWVSAKPKTWEAAVENCSHQRSQLAVLKSKEEMAFIKEMIQNIPAAWMGLSTNQPGGKMWMWQDGSPLQEDL